MDVKRLTNEELYKLINSQIERNGFTWDHPTVAIDGFEELVKAEYDRRLTLLDRARVALRWAIPLLPVDRVARVNGITGEDYHCCQYCKTKMDKDQIYCINEVCPAVKARALLTEMDGDSPRPAKPNMGDDPKWLHSMINSINETINAEMEKRARYEKRLDTLQQNAEIDTEEPDAH